MDPPQVVATNTGWVDNGPNFGSENVQFVTKPKIVLAYGPPTSSLSAGATRFILERKYGYPVTLMYTEHLRFADLSKYNVLILPDTWGGYDGELGEAGARNIKEWVQKGGTLITFGGGTQWLTGEKAALVGNAAPVPIAFEVGVGFFPWFPPLHPIEDPTRERDHLLTLLAAGIRGFNIFMAVERDRYYGAAISARAQIEASWLRTIIAALAEVEWPTLRRHAPIALVDMRADARLGLASNLIDPVTPVLADVLALGPGGAAELGGEAVAIAARRWQTAIARALELDQVPYVIVDEAASEDELARYRAVIAPTHERIDRGLWQRLRALADHKRSIVVIGPGTPKYLLSIQRL